MFFCEGLDSFKTNAWVLNNDDLLPSERTMLFRVSCGCDFLTPFNHSKKPTCRFCGERADWEHISFACPRFLDSGQPKLLSRILDGIADCHDHVLKLYFENWKSKDPAELFRLCLGIMQDGGHWEKSNKTVLRIVSKITATFLCRVDDCWSTQPEFGSEDPAPTSSPHTTQPVFRNAGSAAVTGV